MTYHVMLFALPSSPHFLMWGEGELGSYSPRPVLREGLGVRANPSE
jgi:hypothetical protein